MLCFQLDPSDIGGSVVLFLRELIYSAPTKVVFFCLGFGEHEGSVMTLDQLKKAENSCQSMLSLLSG